MRYGLWFSLILLLSGCAMSTHSTKAAQCPLLPMITVGQTMTVVLSSDNLFVNGSANFQKDAYPTLKALTCVLRSYDKVEIKIKGYTNLSTGVNTNQALSAAQAKAVADYVWSHGVDARLIYAEGLGSAQPIANPTTAKGKALNRRIEVEFMKLG